MTQVPPFIVCPMGIERPARHTLCETPRRIITEGGCIDLRVLEVSVLINLQWPLSTQMSKESICIDTELVTCL